MSALRNALCAIPFVVLLNGFTAAEDEFCKNHYILERPPCINWIDSIAAGWFPTGNLNTERTAHTATRLADGKVLVVGGGRTAGSPELYDPNTGGWALTGQLVTPRTGHTATRLANGKVLVAGGYIPQQTPSAALVNSAELYDPATGTWGSTGGLNVSRFDHTATLLQNGKVLVAGGITQGGAFAANAELYDPDTGSWSISGHHILPRFWHTATLLADGRVLVAGGSHDDMFLYPLADAELYDPATGTWRETGALPTPTSLHTATLLHSGKVLVAAGYAADYPGGASRPRALDKAQLYDPVSGTWRHTAGLNRARESHTATLLPSGEVLVVGGKQWSGAYPAISLSILNNAERYDANTETWIDAGNLNAKRSNHSATLLVTGDILIAGGTGVGASMFEGSFLSSAELFKLHAVAAPAFVVEFYNPDLDNYFIAADAGEQAFVDSGAVGRWQRTGDRFKSGGPAQVCRFGGNVQQNPATRRPYGPNSHFYTADPNECAALQAGFRLGRADWKFESYDFTTTLPGQDGCAAGLKPVYRAYNNGFARGVDSNHRITSDLTGYQAALAAGWIGEGVVMCAQP